MSIVTWTRSRLAKDAAKERLDATPISVTHHGVRVPFKVGSKHDYKRAHSNKEINEAIEKAPLREVQLDGLIAIQHSVHAQKVEEYIDDPTRVPRGTRDPRHGGLVDTPIVIQKNGQQYIHDGHHRLTRSKLVGDTKSEVRFVDFDKE